MPSINTSTLFASPASEYDAKDLNVIGYTDAAEAELAGVERIITSSFNNARSKNDAIVVSSRVTFGTRTFEPGLYYWPIDGQSNIETLLLATPPSPEFGTLFETTVETPTDPNIEILSARRSYLSRGGMVPMSVNMNAVGAKIDFDAGQAGFVLAELLIAKTSTVGKLKVTLSDADTGTEGGFVIIDLAAESCTVTALATFPPLFLAGGQFRADGATYSIADIGDEFSTNLFFRPADEANTKLRLSVELEETPGKLEFMVASDQLAGRQTADSLKDRAQRTFDTLGDTDNEAFTDGETVNILYDVEGNGPPSIYQFEQAADDGNYEISGPPAGYLNKVGSTDLLTQVLPADSGDGTGAIANFNQVNQGGDDIDLKPHFQNYLIRRHPSSGDVQTFDSGGVTLAADDFDWHWFRRIDSNNVEYLGTPFGGKDRTEVEFSGALGPGNGGTINLPLTNGTLTLKHIALLTLSNGSSFSPPLNTGENDNRWWYDFDHTTGVITINRFGAFTGGSYRGVALYST